MTNPPIELNKRLILPGIEIGAVSINFYNILQLNLFVKYQDEATLTQMSVAGKKVIRACLRSSSSKYHLPNKKF